MSEKKKAQTGDFAEGHLEETDIDRSHEGNFELFGEDPEPHVPAPEDDDGPKGADIGDDSDIAAIEDEDPPAEDGEGDAEEDSTSSQTVQQAQQGEPEGQEPTETVTESGKGDTEAESSETTKMSADGAAGKSRSEVLKNARQREAERAIAREERERFLSGWSALQTAMHRRTIVNGVVSSVEVRRMDDAEDAVDLVLLAVMVDGGYKVLVPFEEFYQENPVDMQTVDLSTDDGRRAYTRRRRALAEKLYELKIPMLITDMQMNDRDENGMYDYAIVASRRRALDIQEAISFGGGRSGAPLVKEGEMIQATITSVAVHAVAVVLGGVDVRIPMRLLTYRYLLDARTKYRVGDTLWVYVRQIKELPNGRHAMLLDARMAELQAARMKQKLLPIGTSTLGVITSVRHIEPSAERPDGALNITAYLKMYDMPAVVRGLPASYLGREPISGDELRLVVRGFSRMGFVVAECPRFNGAPGLLNH